MAEPREHPLATELRELAGWLEVPEPPDVRAAVRARLTAQAGERPARRRWWPVRSRWPVASRWPARRRLAVAAVAVLLAGTVAAVPQGRAAVAGTVSGLLRFAGVRVEQDRPPGPVPTVAPSPLPSTRSTSLERARRAARFPIGVPAALGLPGDVQLADPGPDGAPRVVTLLYRGGTIRLDEFDGELDLAFVKQSATADIEWVDLPGVAYGLWLRRPHPVAYVDRQGVTHRETARLAGPTLVWASGRVTYRLEGVPTLAEATRVAGSVR